MTQLAKVAAQRAAANEANAMISTTIMDAQTIDSAHKDRQARAQHLISALVSLFEEEELQFMQEGLLRDLCFAAQRNSEWAHNKLHDMLGEIKEALRNFNGSEIADTTLQRKDEYAQRLEFQNEAWQDLLVASKAAHRSLTGREWLPPAKGRTADQRQTASAAAASARLARYGMDTE